MSFCSGSKLSRHQHWYSSVWVQLECHTCTASVGKPLVKNTFFKSFPKKKNAQVVNLKNPDLDLIRRIHPECGFYGCMIRFWICPKIRKIQFWIRKSGFGFSQKNAPKNSLFSSSSDASTFFQIETPSFT